MAHASDTLAITPAPATEPAVYRGYVLRLLALVFGALGLIGAGVVAVDAYGLFGTRLVPDALFPAHRRASLGGDRALKAIEMKRADPRIIVTGSSRVVAGYDPARGDLAGIGLYNAGLAGAGPLQTLPLSRWAAANLPRLERIVLTLDFDLFFHPTAFRGNFDKSAFAGEPLVSTYLEHVFSTEALTRSWTIARDAVRGKKTPGASAINGSNPVEPTPASEIFARMSREIEAGVELMRDARGLHDPALAAARFAALDAALRDVVARGVAIDVVLNPVFVWRLELVSRYGYWAAMEDWKRRIAAIVAGLPTGSGIGRARVFDFMVVDPATSAPVPRAAGEPPITTYVETSHHTPALGERILRIVSGGEPVDPATGFGQKLEPLVIDAHFERARATFAAWRPTRPEEIAAIAAAIRRVRHDGAVPRPAEP